MATSKLFAVAGVSDLGGKIKVRFASDMTRVKILIKTGHQDIDLIDLPREMTKAEIAQYLFETDFANGRPAVLAAIQDLARKNRVKLTAKAETASVQPETSAELDQATA